MEKEKYLVGLSGGYDSAYAAYTLISRGLEVEGAVLKMGDFTDISLAKAAADMLGIKLNTIDCSRLFRDTVIENFKNEYLCGRTPNPCVVCNRNVKIQALCEYACKNGFYKAVTGHYAKICRDENGEGYFVRMGKDASKDQSYMLWQLTKEQLSVLCCPLADMTKSEIKANAEKAGLTALASLPESQEICFIPDNDHAAFIERENGKALPGKFIDGNGNVLGEHKGIIHYTVGQKKGLGIALGEKYTVTKINASENTVTIEPVRLCTSLMTDTVKIHGVITRFGKEYPCDTEICGKAKLRYGMAPQKASAYIGENGTASVIFDEKVRAATPGQSLVLYDGDGGILLGGIIE